MHEKINIQMEERDSMWPYRQLWPAKMRQDVITYLKIIWKEYVKTEEKNDDMYFVEKERNQILEVYCEFASSLDHL